MKQGIIINVIDVDQTIKYRFFAYNGTTSIGIDFYDYDDCFYAFSDKLINFPSNTSDTIELEFGGKEPLYAYHIYLKIFCYDRTGLSAIHVEADNHLNAPERNKAEFHITTMPTMLNKLGMSLKNWNPKAGDKFEWEAN